jgi:hypothetical protein
MTQQGPTIKSWQFRKLRGLLSVALFALACALAGAGLTAEPTQKPFVIEHYALRNGRDWDVYAARVTAQGKVLDANGLVVAGGQHNQCRPDVGFAADFYLVVWQEFVGDGTPNTPGNAYVVRGKRVSSNGKPADDQPIEIARIEKESHALNPVLACQESTALVGFTVRAFASGNDYFARRPIDVASGRVLGPTPEPSRNSAKPPIHLPASEGKRRVVVFWLVFWLSTKPVRSPCCTTRYTGPKSGKWPWMGKTPN